MPLRDYPKTVALKSGREVLLRPVRPEDEGALLDFFRAVPAEDRLFLKDDVTDPAVIHRWTHAIDIDRVISLLAFDGPRVVGDATLHRQPGGWSPHVGEIRVVTAKDWRGQGLGKVLAREIFHLALSLGLEKVQAQVMANQTGALNVFRSLGFIDEAVLRNHVRDRQGVKHDLVIMTQDVEAFWRRMEDFIAESHRDYSGDYESH